MSDHDVVGKTREGLLLVGPVRGCSFIIFALFFARALPLSPERASTGHRGGFRARTRRCGSLPRISSDVTSQESSWLSKIGNLKSSATSPTDWALLAARSRCGRQLAGAAVWPRRRARGAALGPAGLSRQLRTRGAVPPRRSACHHLRSRVTHGRKSRFATSLPRHLKH